METYPFFDMGFDVRKTEMGSHPVYQHYYQFWSKIIFMEVIPYIIIFTLNLIIVSKIFESINFRRKFEQKESAKYDRRASVSLQLTPAIPDRSEEMGDSLSVVEMVVRKERRLSSPVIQLISRLDKSRKSHASTSSSLAENVEMKVCVAPVENMRDEENMITTVDDDRGNIIGIKLMYKIFITDNYS